MNLAPHIDKIIGFRVAGIHAGLKVDGALDLALIVSDRPCATACVFTQNQMLGAPVIVTRRHWQKNPQTIRGVVINTKIANAATGEQGIEDACSMARATAERLNCQPEQVLVMSTGVIGAHLPMPKILAGIQNAHAQLRPDQWAQTADAIRTTDTRPKLVSKTVYTSDGHYTIAGIAKGSGMIAPNMATMLSIIVTDAQLSHSNLQTCLDAVNRHSFNCIVVDGDTSPNDMVVLMANGASGVAIRTDSDLEQFQRALLEVAQYLAQAIVRDGEGVSKFITLRVIGAQSQDQAHIIAHTIATSPLVKTAFAGGDANWGRIIAAAGRAPTHFNPDIAHLWIATGETTLTDVPSGLQIFERGMPAIYQEEDAAQIMRQPAITVTLDCGMGQAQATVWTCDLTHDYISINADYRT